MGQFQSMLFPGDASGQQQQPQDDVPWMLRYGARIAGAVTGITCLICGVFNLLSILSPLCIVAGIYLMMAGFVLVVLEAPCCCFFLDHVQKASAFGDSRPYWQKALFYLLLAFPALIVCWGISLFIACIFIFGTAALYGMMALGKKASREDMLMTASTSKTNLVDKMPSDNDWQQPPPPKPDPSTFP